jgi:hypothetical protein
MRRFLLPIFASLAVATLAAGCNDKAPSAAATSAAPAATASPTPRGDDKTACATAKSTRDSVLNDLIMSMLTIADTDSSKAALTDAAAKLQAALTKLHDGMAKAAGQAESEKLRGALQTYAAGAETEAKNVATAGTDQSKLDAATDLPSMDDAEKTVMTICS